MPDNRIYLKVKIKSLAAEANIIRKEEAKNTKVNEHGYNQTRNELRLHRVGIVRSEARHTLLAYGFIRGRTYRQIEPYGNGKTINWDKVWKMVEKYGDWTNNADQKVRFEQWKSDNKIVEAVREEVAVSNGILKRAINYIRG